ncbi:MAG: murein transglycosylase [Plesiomonas sp.]|uniref:murein transglycosylase n=1 Tax=Plesiomonas sp. TaxID=2486279 RepID=UPI003F3FAA89
MRQWILSFCVISVGSTSMLVHAAPTANERQAYQQAKTALDNNQPEVATQLLPALKNYPLYPYIEYRLLTRDMSQLTAAQARHFIERYQTMPLAKGLPERFSPELTRRQDWKTLLTLMPQAPSSIAGQCRFYYANYAVGKRQQAWEGAKKVWLTGKSLPDACDPLIDAWKSSSAFNAINVLDRMVLAMKTGNDNLLTHLATLLPQMYRSMANGLLALQANPSQVLSFAQTHGASPIARQATLVAFNRLVRSDPDNARSLITSLAKAQAMSHSQVIEMESAVALRMMDATDAAQIQWRDSIVQRSQNTALIERRIRLALSRNDLTDTGRWIARLPAADKEKDEWVYWHARVLQQQGKQQQAHTELRRLTERRGFYPMVAAQQLHQSYIIKNDSRQVSTQDVSHWPEIVRIRELLYWDLHNIARSEWSSLIGHYPTGTQAVLTAYARRQGWSDLSVQGTIRAKLWDHIDERFPMAYPNLFTQATRTKNITPSYAMAIARQESAWNPDAQSPVGARGLMQLMPKTAQHTAKKNSIILQQDSQLFQPETNIQLGTAYLDEVYQQFGRNRILATAAYNAGPSRVKRWLNNANSQLDALAFIESIPFNETRGYVKNVLAYDVFYRYQMKNQQPVLTAAELNQRY